MLKYNTDAEALLPGVPGRDLDNQEIEQCGGEQFLLSLQSGGVHLYWRDERPITQPKASKREDIK